MSFSSEVKDELYKVLGKNRHCLIAELGVFIHAYGRVSADESGCLNLVISTEHEGIARKCFTLLEKTFNIDVGVLREDRNFVLNVRGDENVASILSAVKMWNRETKEFSRTETVSDMLTAHSCCKRAFLRAAFIQCGSVSDPEKDYHLEFACQSPEAAEKVIKVLRDFEIDAKSVLRKKYFVVYIKEGSSVVEALNVLGAHVSLMNLENSRILKEIANNVNRKVNCEAANLLKSVNAANSQLDDIRLIAEKIGLDALPPQLREMAEIRLAYPDAPLKDLGGYLSPPIGKSGVNHRLRKLSETADGLRG